MFAISTPAPRRSGRAAPARRPRPARSAGRRARRGRRRDGRARASRPGRGSRAASSRPASSATAASVSSWRKASRSRSASSPPASSATITGSDFLRPRRSLPTGLPVTSGSPQMPSTSSTAWNDRPSSNPKRSSAAVMPAPAPPSTAPIATEPPSRAPVLLCSISTHSASVTSLRRSRALSWAWPVIIAAVASASSRRAAVAPGLQSSTSTWNASVCSASPTRMASLTP